jgi:hypothetical protein
LEADPEYRAWLREPAAINSMVDEHLKLAEAWAVIARKDFMEGRPFSISPEPKFRHIAQWAVEIAFPK